MSATGKAVLEANADVLERMRSGDWRDSTGRPYDNSSSSSTATTTTTTTTTSSPPPLSSEVLSSGSWRYHDSEPVGSQDSERIRDPYDDDRIEGTPRYSFKPVAVYIVHKTISSSSMSSSFE